MNARKRRRLEAAGWRLGSAADFLALSEEEAAIIEMKVTLGASVRRWRLRANLTQTALAKGLESSQSRLAKLEAGDPSVSLDLLFRAAFAAGAKRAEVARALARPRRAAAR